MRKETKHTIVHARFILDDATCTLLQSKKQNFGFGGFGEVTYYRTYSRIKADGSQEHWADTVIRVINGVISIRKNHYQNNQLSWDENYWQDYGKKMALSMFDMKWLPPGRGLWAMGTQYVYERGAAALNNCGAVDTKKPCLSSRMGYGYVDVWCGRRI
nr:hypothetical protein [Sulfurimonas sp. MAG313]